MSRVVVVGAAGQTGRHVLSALRDRGADVTAMVHDAARRHVATDAGAASVVVGDLEDPTSMRDAFAGAHTVLMIPPVLHPREDELVVNAVVAAAAVGVERFVLHSVLHPYTPTMPHHLRKATAEAAVRASHLRWTILQPAMYAQTVLLYRSKQDDTELRVPWDVTRRFSVVDVQDVAEATASTILNDGHDYASYELAGPRALSMLAMAEHLSALTGAPLRAVTSAPESFQPPPSWSATAVADATAMFTEYDQHGLLGNPTVLRALLGREPTTFIEAMRCDLR